MPFLFLVIGSVFVIAGVRDKATDLTGLLKGDFTGKGNYVYWMLAILVIGALGYVENLKPLSRAFLVLVLIVLFLSNKGFFTKFNQQIGETQTSGAQSASSQTIPAIPSLVNF